MSFEAMERFSIDCNWPLIRAAVPWQKIVVTVIVLQTFVTIIHVIVIPEMAFVFFYLR